MRRARLEGVERVDLALVGGQDFLNAHPLRRWMSAVLSASGIFASSPRPPSALAAMPPARLRAGGGPSEAAQLAHGAGQGEIGRDDARGGVLADARGFLIEHPRVGGDNREIRLGFFAIGDGIRLARKIGDKSIIAGQLRHRAWRLCAMPVSKLLGIDCVAPW